MGGVFGHMSHLYDNPDLKFSQLKDVFNRAATGRLHGTEKTDGQNLFVSYDINDNTVRAARNKGNIKDGGLTIAQLADKFAGRGPLSETFVEAFEAFEVAISRMPEDLRLKLFGPDANIYYNAEIQDPRSANVINYDVKTLNIHRVGHAEYDKETGKPIKNVNENAEILESYLNDAQEDIQGDYRVQVNAVRQLQKLSNNSALDEALVRLERFTSNHGLSDNNTIGEYLVRRLDDHLTQKIVDLSLESKKLLMKRMFEEVYGTKEKDGKKKPKVTQKSIIDSLVNKENATAAKQLIGDAKQLIGVFIFPIEDIVHDFSVEMLKGLESAFVLDNEEEVERQRREVAVAIEAIEGSGNEEAMAILQKQMKKLKRVENISTAAEGFVFDYDGRTYKFTGNFAPINQILGLFKYGRGSVPPLKPLDAAAVLAEAFVHKGDEFLFIPGGFKPPHKGHVYLLKNAMAQAPKAKPFLVTGESDRDGVTLQQGMQIWKIFLQHDPEIGVDELSIITVPEGGLPVLDRQGRPIKDASGKMRTSNSPLQAIYNSALGLPEGATVYIASSAADPKHALIGESISAARPDLKVQPLSVATLDDEESGGKFSASNLRRAILDGDFEEFKRYLPADEKIQKQADHIFINILRAKKEENEPMAESFRADDIHGLIEELIDSIDEESSMSGGSVAGGMIGTGSKKGPWADLDVDDENEKQKKHQKLKGEKQKLVGEVVDYLLYSGA